MSAEREKREKSRWRVSRRGFLVGLGVTGVGLALGVRLGTPVVRRRIAGYLDGATIPVRADHPPGAWFEVSEEGRVTLFVPKVEMGQGIHTALAQIAAEELGVPWEDLDVAQASTARGFRSLMGTSGSFSVSTLYTPLREAAATLRETLRLEAARQLGLPADELRAEGGVFRHEATNRSLGYGEVVAATDIATLEVPDELPPLKAASEFTVIGRSLPRVDLLDKLTGRAVYGYDARLPNMAYGAVARPPRLGARPKTVESGAASTLEGVVRVVVEDNFVGVVATSRARAYDALDALDISWEGGLTLDQADIDAMVSVDAGNGVEIQREGDPAEHLQGRTLEATYRTPFAAHAHLEPQAALVAAEPDSVVVFASTQFPDSVRNDVAEVLGRDPDEVEVTATYLGGGFGRKAGSDVSIEAARLSAAAGRPVHVGWNRSEDLRYGYVRPPTQHVLRAALDPSGYLAALEHRQASGDVAFAFLPGVAALVMGADFGAWRGAMIPYNVPHKRTIAHRVELPVPTGWWRGLGLLPNTFAQESFIDELAYEAGADPLEFRLHHLPRTELGERFRRVLETAAARAAWSEPPPRGRARGLALCVDAGTVVAEVAEVSVEGENIRVHRVSAAIDPGLVINPDGVEAQTQGAIIMGLSSTLLEALTLKNGMYEAANFDRYPLLTLKDAPDIEVVVLESGDTPHGVGEPPIGPIAAAVANAVFALTGERLRDLPLRLS